MATPVPDDLLELIVDGAWVPADAPTIQEEGGNVTTLRFSEGPTLRHAVSSLDLAPLRAKALELEATSDEGVTRSNVGGFHGHTDAFELAECAAARAFLEAAAPEAAAARPAKRARFDVEVEGARLVVDGGGGAYALTVGVEDGVLSLDAAARAGDADRGGGGARRVSGVRTLALRAAACSGDMACSGASRRTGTAGGGGLEQLHQPRSCALACSAEATALPASSPPTVDSL